MWRYVLEGIGGLFMVFGMVMTAAMAMSNYKLRNTKTEKCPTCGNVRVIIDGQARRFGR